ncbi:MAG: hypothetical protein AB7O26_04950 [Planctomycetaceae bacterium]
MDQLLTAPTPVHEGSWTPTDAEFLKSLAWGRAGSIAPLKQAAKKGNAGEFARLLERHLRKQFPTRKPNPKKPAPPAQRVLWSRPAFDDSLRSVALSDIVAKFDAASTHAPAAPKVRKNSRKKLATKRTPDAAAKNGLEPSLVRWLDGLDRSEALLPYEQLLLADVLRRANIELSRGTIFRIWRLLLETALTSGDSGGSETASAAELLTDRALVERGELPWALATLFAGLSVADQLFETARQALRGSLLEGTDELGMPRADLLERLPFWLAAFVRARDCAAQAGLKLWDAKCERRFKLLAHSAAMLCRADGRLPLGNGYSTSAIDLLSAASTLAGLNEKSAPRVYLQELSNHRFLAAHLKGKKGRKGGLRRRRANRKSTSGKAAEKFPAVQSDWARLACLRSGWSIDADALIVTHHDSMPSIELSAFSVTLLSGKWEVAITLESNPLDFENVEWHCVCWFSDEDADYIELRADHPAGVRVERQLLLSREEHFALFAEILSGPHGARIECESRLPPIAGATIVPDRPTRECRLKVPGCSARVFPLMLPAERAVGASGSLGLVDDALHLRQIGVGGMYAPLVIDWHPDRARAYAEWRKLTVSEQGKAVPSDVAGGCRLRVGSDQWLFYHGMKRSQGGRAILGQHTFNETLIGRFKPDGTTDPIILVEQQEA